MTAKKIDAKSIGNNSCTIQWITVRNNKTNI